MNWDAVGAIGEILGAIAVFCSLLYLAVQIKTSNTIARIEGRENALDRLDNWRSKMIFDQRLDDIFERGCNDPAVLNENELRQFDRLAHQLFMNIRVQYMRAYDLKHLEEMERMEVLCKLWAKQQGIVQRWKEVTTPIEEPCLAMMEKYLGKRPTDGMEDRLTRWSR